jgi:hypothetical protein
MAGVVTLARALADGGRVVWDEPPHKPTLRAWPRWHERAQPWLRPLPAGARQPGVVHHAEDGRGHAPGRARPGRPAPARRGRAPDYPDGAGRRGDPGRHAARLGRRSSSARGSRRPRGRSTRRSSNARSARGRSRRFRGSLGGPSSPRGTWVSTMRLRLSSPRSSAGRSA